MSSKKSKEALQEEIKRTKVKVDVGFVWGKPRAGKKIDPGKRLFGVSLTAEDTLTYEKLYKVFPVIQKRFQKLMQYDVKEYETVVCTEFGFSLETFKPVGQLSLPADMPLTPKLTERLGEPMLTGFEIGFKNSPLGLKETTIELNEEEGELSVFLTSSFRPKSLKEIVVNAFEHAFEIARLFVVKKK